MNQNHMISYPIIIEILTIAVPGAIAKNVEIPHRTALVIGTYVNSPSNGDESKAICLIGFFVHGFLGNCLR